MQSPIQNRVGMVFIPVRDVQSAIGWYSRLLGVPSNSPSHRSAIYDLPMVGETGVILDSTKPIIQNSAAPFLLKRRYSRQLPLPA